MNSSIVGVTLTKTALTRSTPKADTNTANPPSSSPATAPASAPVPTAAPALRSVISPPSTRGFARIAPTVKGAMIEHQPAEARLVADEVQVREPVGEPHEREEDAHAAGERTCRHGGAELAHTFSGSLTPRRPPGR